MSLLHYGTPVRIEANPNHGFPVLHNNQQGDNNGYFLIHIYLPNDSYAVRR